MNAHRFTSLIGIVTGFGYMLSLLLPFFATYNTANLQANDEGLFAALTGGKILICTVNGYELVSPGDVGDGKHEPNEDFKCGLCVLAANGFNLAMASAPLSLHVAGGVQHATAVPDYRAPIGAYYLSHAQPRAPPVA